MKEYKNNQELIDYLISKNVIINDVQSALKNIEKYTYYSIVNGYKSVFKDEENNYKDFCFIRIRQKHKSHISKI